MLTKNHPVPPAAALPLLEKWRGTLKIVLDK